MHGLIEREFGAMKKIFGKLNTLTIKGYKSIHSMEKLPMNSINVVIGQNGAGKSNFISLFGLLSRLVQEELQDHITKQGGLHRILYFGPKVTDKLEIAFVSDLNEYYVALIPTMDGRLLFFEEKCSFNGTKKDICIHGQFETQLIKTQKAGKIPLFITHFIKNWRVYHFHDTSDFSPLRASAPLTEPERLAADGSNLPSFLYYLQQEYPDQLEMLLDTVRLVAPFFGDFVLKPEALNKNLIRLRWRHKGRDALFDVADLSDGTLRFIALAALLLQPDPPETIILDEPELGLHPAAIALLAALMHQAASKVQIIAATQSPTFANHFGWQDFIVADRVDNASRFRRLTEMEVAPWAEEFGMGEAWEKNFIGGRP
jgi:predicted ATPase